MVIFYFGCMRTVSYTHLHLKNGEEYLLDVLENIESDETIEGLKAKAGLAEYRKKYM